MVIGKTTVGHAGEIHIEHECFAKHDDTRQQGQHFNQTPNNQSACIEHMSTLVLMDQIEGS